MKKNHKRLFSAALSIIVLLSLVSCRTKQTENEETPMIKYNEYIIEFLKKEISLSTYIITEDNIDNKEYFYTEGIPNSVDNQLTITWKNDTYGQLVQIFNFENNSADLKNASYSLEFIPKVQVKGIIVQEYDFVPSNIPYFMMPGALYGTNNIESSTGYQPRLDYKGEINYPKTPILYYRADRSTHNTVAAMFDNISLSIRIDETTNDGTEQFYNGIGVDTAQPTSDKIAVTLGYMDYPVHYYGKLHGKYYTKDAEYYGINFSPQKTYTSLGHLYLNQKENIYAYQDALKYFYNKIHEFPGNTLPRDEAIVNLATAIVNDGYNPDFNNFALIVRSNGDKYEVKAGDTSWTGGMQVAYPLLKAYSYVPKAKDVATSYIDELITDGVNPNTGLFYESKWEDNWVVSGWWANDLASFAKQNDVGRVEYHTGYVNGQASTYLLKAYQYAKENDMEIENLEDWYSTAKNIIDLMIEKQNEDGALPALISSKSGKALYYDSFQGAWFMAGIAEMYKITGDKKYYNAYKKADDHYYSFIENMEVWGMPMDIQGAVDEEGNLAYITAAATMHQLTNEDVILERLVNALHYEFTWKFPYNTMHTNEPLKSLQWPSSGGSATSTHNVHIHQMGNLIAEEMYYAYTQTNDEYIKSRLMDTLNWGLGTFNSSEYDFGFGEIGWATEQFFHSDGLQDDQTRVIDGGIWPDYLPWAASCVLLSTTADIPDEFFYEK